MLIDAHTHAFADKIAEKAVLQLIDYYSIPTTHGGTISDLMHQAQLARLDAMVMLVAATKAEQVKPANDWMLSRPWEAFENHPIIISFGSYHVDDENWQNEINRLGDAGIKGIKIHPEFQQIDLSDPRLLPFCEEIQGKFILMVHVGDPVVTADNYSTPAKVANLLDLFPNLTIIAAHLGGYCFWDEAHDLLAGKNVYLDTSSAAQYIDPELMKNIVRRHGVENILCGSDYPLTSPIEAINSIMEISWLSDEEKSMITGENAVRLFGIS
jgi:predicted TIM-barrel fold metal-dependent hydrolase